MCRTEKLAFKGPFTLSVRVNAAVSLVIALWLKYLDFLMNQTSHSKYGLQPQLIRYDTSIDADAPNKSLTLSVNRP